MRDASGGIVPLTCAWAMEYAVDVCWEPMVFNGIYNDLMGLYSDLMGLYSDLMGLYSDLMGLYSDLMEFYSDSMGFIMV